MIVDEIDIARMSAFEAKNHPPIARHPYRPVPSPIALEGMQTQAGQSEMLGLLRVVHQRQDLPQFLRQCWPYAASVVFRT